MKITTLNERLAVVIEDSVVDVKLALDAGAPPPASDKWATSTLAVLRDGDAAFSWLGTLVAWVTETAPAGRPKENVSVPIRENILGPPVIGAAKILGVGLNYRDHAEEQHVRLPTSPILFAKFSNTLVGSGSDVVRPFDTEKLDFEAELAVVIGKEGRRIKEADAMSHVAGYACFNDITARDFQFLDRQWHRGKNGDTFAPMGPFLVTKDEVPDPHELGIRLWLNGDLMQDSNTRNLVFGIEELVAFASSFCTLEPGDVIATGTPGGVGFARQPEVFMFAGDKVAVEIDGLGRLENTIVDERI